MARVQFRWSSGGRRCGDQRFLSCQGKGSCWSKKGMDTGRGRGRAQQRRCWVGLKKVKESTWDQWKEEGSRRAEKVL